MIVSPPVRLSLHEQPFRQLWSTVRSDSTDNYCGNEENTRVKEDMMQGGTDFGIWYTTSKKLLMALDLQPTYHMTS